MWNLSIHFTLMSTLYGMMSKAGTGAQALVSGVPRGAMVLLDLYAEVFPLWQRTHSFFGAPFIYCMLHNFGGNSGV